MDVGTSAVIGLAIVVGLAFTCWFIDVLIWFFTPTAILIRRLFK